MQRLAASATLFTILKWCGAAYLVWLGIKLWRAGGTLDDARLAEVIRDYRAAAWEVALTDRLRATTPTEIDEERLRAEVRRPDEILRYDPAPVLVRELFE